MGKLSEEDIIQLVLNNEYREYIDNIEDKLNNKEITQSYFGNALTSYDLDRYDREVINLTNNSRKVNDLLNEYITREKEKQNLDISDNKMASIMQYGSAGTLGNLTSGNSDGSFNVLIKAAIFFELSYEETRELFAASGISFKDHDRYQAVLKIAIENNIYDVDKINQMLERSCGPDIFLDM